MSLSDPGIYLFLDTNSENEILSIALSQIHMTCLKDSRACIPLRDSRLLVNIFDETFDLGGSNRNLTVFWQHVRQVCSFSFDIGSFLVPGVGVRNLDMRSPVSYTGITSTINLNGCF